MSMINSTLRDAKATFNLLFPGIPGSTGGTQERAGIISHLLRSDSESGRFTTASERASQRNMAYNHQPELSVMKNLLRIRDFILPKVPK